MSYNVYKESGDVQAFDAALADEKRAIQAWRDIVEAAASVYSDKLPFGAPGHFPRHWKEELDRLESDFQRLASVRQALPSHPGIKAVPFRPRLPAERCRSHGLRMTRLPLSAGISSCPRRSRRLPTSNGSDFGIGISRNTKIMKPPR